MRIHHLKDLDLKGRRVLIRSDLNVPIDNGKITSDRRIKASLETIRDVIESKASKIIIASHLGRPNEGEYNPEFSLRPIVNCLQEIISLPIRLVKDYVGGKTLPPDRIIVLENVRFNVGEANNSESLSRTYASMCDVFVMDAFGTAHRMHSSSYGVCNFVPLVCSGFLLSEELENVDRFMKNPVRPVLSIVGGSKVSTKIRLLKSLLNISDRLAVGGGIANTFFSAMGFNVGRSVFESDYRKHAEGMMESEKILLPVDVKIESKISSGSENRLISEVGGEDCILDIGSRSIELIRDAIKKSNTVIWIGPVGAFEIEGFGEGTREIIEGIASGKPFSMAGGGDTIAAIDKFNADKYFSYISTGGSAFLRLIEDGKLPAVLALQNNWREDRFSSPEDEPSSKDKNTRDSETLAS